MSADQNNTNKNIFMGNSSNFLRKAWPINWNNFKNLKLIQQVLVAAPYPFKATLLIFTTIVLVSLGFFGFGSYLVLTKEVPGNGGLIREAVIASDVKVFNPVLELNSPMEKKVVELIYHPLYNITYPDLSVASASPIIKPMLLSKAPEWQDLAEIKPENRYKRLRFTLKNNLKWSNDSKITTSDVEYTFESLKQDSGNSIFRAAFAGITFETISETEFDLVAQLSTPKLLYSANFSPVSKTFYEAISTEKMLTDPRSFKPTVTSGYFTFSTGTSKDPDTNASRENPFRDASTGLIEAVLLDRNKVQNTGENILVDQYYIQKVSNLYDTGGNTQSVERLAKSGKLDLFQRNLASDLGVSSEEIASRLKMSQAILPSNTFYGLYLNIKLDNSTGYFINQFLRKYVICNFLNYQLDSRYSSHLDNIETSKRLVPIIFGESVNSDCPDNVDTVLDNPKSSSGEKVYTIKFDPSTGIKRVLLFGEEFRITLVGPPNTEPLLSDIQSFFLSIGVPANLISNPDQVANSLQSKTYNAAFLPVTYTSQDPYPLFGVSGQDILQASKNNRILSYKLEENLRKFSDSNLTDEASRKTLVDFFSKEYVAVNLFRSKQEINYTSKIANIKTQLPALITFNEEIYSQIPTWYVATKRQFWFEN
jgi:Bacterial extracellular solute-binding proteins, family 5 Middle